MKLKDFNRFFVILICFTLFCSILPILPKEKVYADESHISTSLNWLRKQLDPPAYPAKLSLSQQYSEDYTGSVSGKVDLSTIPGYTTKKRPYLQTNIVYGPLYSGEVNGLWRNIQNPTDYSVIIYDRTDMNYEIAKVQLNEDGTWSGGSHSFKGTPVIALADKENKIVAYTSDKPLQDTISEYEVWIYSVSDIPYLQTKVPIRMDGSFTTEETINFFGAEFDAFKGVKEGKKIARLVRVSDGKVYGTTEVPKYELIRSYNVPMDDPVNKLGIDRRSWIYDDALAVFSFSLAQDQERASTILSSLNKLQNSDGSLAFSYDIYSGPLDTQVRSGSLAWVGDSAVKYEEMFGDNTYREFATSIADYLLTLQDKSTGSIKGGPDVPWYSTEHNIDSYFFFRNLGTLTKNSKYTNAANKVQNALLTYHWNHAQKRFNQGIGDEAAALDTNSWGSIFLEAIGRDDLAKTATAYIDRFEVNNVPMSLSNNNEDYNMKYSTDALVSGYKPYQPSGDDYKDAPSIVWTEGTWGVINLFLRQGKNVDNLVNSMFVMQNADPEGGLVYANKGYAPYPYEFHVWPSVAGTAWQYITLKDPQGIWSDNTKDDTGEIVDLLEHNNTKESAAEIGFTSFDNLNLHSSTDVDYYKFTADFTDEIKVVIPTVKDYKLEVYTPDGPEISYTDTGYQVVDLYVEEGQTYYIKVHSPGGLGDSHNPYSLKLVSEPSFKKQLTLDHLNQTIDSQKINAMQYYLSKMKFYSGPLTGAYTNEFFESVLAYQAVLNKWDARTAMNGQFTLDGTITDRLLTYARDDHSLGRDAKGSIYKVFFNGDKIIMALAGEYAAGAAFESLVLYKLGKYFKADNFVAKSADTLVKEADDVVPILLKEDIFTHLTTAVKFTQGKGIIGGHNMEEFFSYLEKNNIKYRVKSKTKHPNFEGIYDITYEWPKKDDAGNQILEGTWKSTTKTVYDPNVYSNEEIFQLGQQAMQEGVKAKDFFGKDTAPSRGVRGTAPNGLRFHGFQSKETGEFTSFFPVLE